MSKRALIVGINEFETVSPLRGCVNDTQTIRDVLKRHYGFEDVKILTDAEATAAAIRSHLSDWLLTEYAGDGSDVRLFHFSSHGTQVPDQGDDEWECQDEAIVTYDHDWDNPFRDDDLREIFDPVPENVNFTFIADCCHSGSIQRAALDENLQITPRYVPPPPEVRREIEQKLEARDAAADKFAAAKLAEELRGVPQEQWAARMQALLSGLRNSYRDNRFGVVPVGRHVLFAGCQDKQTAADAFIDNAHRGAFTWGLTQAIADAGRRSDARGADPPRGREHRGLRADPPARVPPRLEGPQVPGAAGLSRRSVGDDGGAGLAGESAR